MAMDLTYKPFSGVGVLNFFRRNAAGAIVGGGFDMGESSKLSIAMQAPKLELKTSRSRDRGVAFTMAQEKTSNVVIELRTLNDFILGLLTSGSWTETAASAAVSGWDAPDDLVVGQVIKLPHQNVSLVTVTDSTPGTPKQLPAGQYELDPVGGTIKLLDITTGGGFVQPFQVSYTPGAVKVLGAFKASDEDFFLHFNGTNAYDGDRVICEVFKFRFAPEGEFELIATEYGTYTLNGSVQKDETRPSNSAGGQYYSLTKPGA
jgi:hypothetical protein